MNIQKTSGYLHLLKTQRLGRTPLFQSEFSWRYGIIATFGTRREKLYIYAGDLFVAPYRCVRRFRLLRDSLLGVVVLLL